MQSYEFAQARRQHQLPIVDVAVDDAPGRETLERGNARHGRVVKQTLLLRRRQAGDEIEEALALCVARVRVCSVIQEHLQDLRAPLSLTTCCIEGELGIAVAQLHVALRSEDQGSVLVGVKRVNFNETVIQK